MQLDTIPQDPYQDPPSPGIQPPPSEVKTSEPRGWRSALSTILILIAAPLIAIFLTAFVFQSYEVDGPSMETTLQNNDRLIVLKVPRTWARITRSSYIPKRGEIIIFVKRGVTEFGTNKDKQLIKRVIALPGDRVVVNNGKVTIYNASSPEGFNPDLSSEWSEAIKSTQGNVDITVPAGEVFVCGDNRANSLDSRTFGTIPVNDIVGRLAIRLLPLNKTKFF